MMLSKVVVERNGVRRGTRPLRRMAGCVVTLMLAASCSGPQSLKVAIDPQDETTYVRYLNGVDGDGRTAFAKWMASERGTAMESVLKSDAEMSTTRNPFDAYQDGRAVSRGAVIYHIHCARCHADDARGRGPAILPEHPATDFKTFGKRFAATLHRGAPRKWFRVISGGSGDVVDYPDERTTAMPAFDTQLTREQIWLVITYLQSLDARMPDRNAPS